jgi:hypothetical protein
VFGFGFFGSGVGAGFGCGLTTGGFSFGGRLSLSSPCAEAITDKLTTSAHATKNFCNIFIILHFLFPFIQRLGERGESRVSA